MDASLRLSNSKQWILLNSSLCTAFSQTVTTLSREHNFLETISLSLVYASSRFQFTTNETAVCMRAIVLVHLGALTNEILEILVQDNVNGTVEVLEYYDAVSVYLRKAFINVQAL